MSGLLDIILNGLLIYQQPVLIFIFCVLTFVPMVLKRDLTVRTPKTHDDKVVYSLKYFDDIKKLKGKVYSLKSDIKELCGDIQIIFGLRKHVSIGNRYREHGIFADLY